MFRKNLRYCLVLAGGAKGVYHIGAWKALQEMDVKVNAFIGNSIGAIIAGFLAQGEYKVCSTRQPFFKGCPVYANEINSGVTV